MLGLSLEEGRPDVFTVPVQVWVILHLMGPGPSGGAIPGRCLKALFPPYFGVQNQGE